MPGDVHKSRAKVCRQVEVGEAKVDGDAAALFFFQAVRVNASQRLNQRGLAMIDVARSADDDAPFQRKSLKKKLCLALQRSYRSNKHGTGSWGRPFGAAAVLGAAFLCEAG